MRDRKESDASATARSEAETPPQGTSLRERKLHQRRAERAGRNVEIVEPRDDEMSVVAVEETDIQTVRNRMIGRVDRATDRGWLMLDRFQSVLRQRDAEPALEKGFGEVARKTVVDWFADHLKDGLKEVLEAAELPIAVAEKGVGVIRESVEGVTEAAQAGAKLAAVDRIVEETRRALQGAAHAAFAAINNAAPAALFKADAAAEGEIIASGDVDELVTRLLGLLTERLCATSELTAGECVDRIQHDRAHAADEAGEAARRQKE